jgi:iron complex outermembrane receptor protein
MKFPQKKIAVALTYALGCGGAAGLLTSGLAGAQQTPPTEAPKIKVEVTGSNIPRLEGEGSVPLQIITRDDIDRSGATTTMELLDLISANNSLGQVSLPIVIGATTFSNQTASLRGLGGSSTLVLVNGKRLGVFSGGISGTEGTNLATIPVSAIQRVEVLLDGASAIYGADAVAGVINFIMKEDYQGAEATLWGGTPTQGSHGREWNISATAGYGDLAKDKWNVYGNFFYQEQRPFYDIDRGYSNSSYIPSIGLNSTSGQTFPGYISTGGIGSLTFPNCAPSVAIGTRCRYDPNSQPGVESIPDTKQTNFFGAARYQINNDWQAYLTGLYSKTKNEFIIQPVPLSDQIATISTPTGAANILLPPSSPYYPTAAAIAAGVNGQPLNVRWRCYPCGNRDTTDTNEAYQVVAGAKGTAWGWSFDGSFNYSQNTFEEVLNGGFPLYSKILPLLNSGTIDLLTGMLPADQSAAVNATNFNAQTANGKQRQYGVDLVGSADIYQLPAGPLSTAIGLQTSNQNQSQNFNPTLATGDVSGYGGNFPSWDHSRTQWAVFGELTAPIVKNFDIDAAVRYDHYSDFGSTTNPKFSARWQAADWLLLRASYNTGFLAPTLYQLWNPVATGLSSPGVSDPLRCPNPNAPDAGNNPDCNTQYSTTVGGNPTLKPTTSSQWSVGGVFSPYQGVTFGADYFQLNLSNIVATGVPIGTILNPAFYSTYSYLVSRQANCVGGQPCPITFINQQFANFGKNRIQGWDVSAQLISPVSQLGRFKLGLNGTYYTRYDTQNPDGSYSSIISTQFGVSVTGVTPRWKSYIPLTWDLGPWSATIANTYASGYIDNNPDPNGNTRNVPPVTLWDAQIVYTGFKNLTLTIGMKNVLNTNPPLTNQNNTFQAGYDPSYWDPRGQFLYGSIKYVFGKWW